MKFASCPSLPRPSLSSAWRLSPDSSPDVFFSRCGRFPEILSPLLHLGSCMCRLTHLIAVRQGLPSCRHWIRLLAVICIGAHCPESVATDLYLDPSWGPRPRYISQGAVDAAHSVLCLTLPTHHRTRTATPRRPTYGRASKSDAKPPDTRLKQPQPCPSATP